MPSESAVGLDARFAAACEGDAPAFADWMACVERPIQNSLRRFARVVDLEVVMQETFLRMWVIARNRGRTLEGPNASLRFAFRVARNVALEEVRRARLGTEIPLEGLEDPPEPAVHDAPPSDPALLRIITACLEALPRRPREAILARVRMGFLQPDRELASQLAMTLNTFLQNVVRARALLATCLEGRGVALEEHLP